MLYIPVENGKVRGCEVIFNESGHPVRAKELFKNDANYVLKTMFKLMKINFGHQEYGDKELLKAKMYNVLKRHHIHATWYGDAKGVHQPDRWELTQHGVRYFIQL